MKVLLILGCVLVVVAAQVEDVPDSQTTATTHSNQTLGESHASGQSPVPSDPQQDTAPSDSTTQPTAAEEPTTNSSLRTTSDTTLPPSDVHEGPVNQTMPPITIEGEVHAVMSTTPTTTPTTTTTTTIVPAAAPTTSPPPSSAADTETTGAQETSPGSTSQGLATSTPTAAASQGAEGGVDLQSSPTPTPTLLPTTSTQRATEKEEEEEQEVQESTIMQTTTTTTTTATATTAKDTLAMEHTAATTDTPDVSSTTTTATAVTITTTVTVDSTDITAEVSSHAETAASNATYEASGGCFGKTEVNTLVVVAVVVAVNVVSVVLTAVCVHRLVSRRLSWDPPPMYRHRSTRSSGKGDMRTRGTAGRNLASDKECKAGEGEGQASTQIPILITNEDGWCVPYSNEAQEGRKKREKEKSSPTEDTGV